MFKLFIKITIWRKLLSVLLVMSCITTSLVLPSLGFAQGAVTLQLPKPGTMVGFSEQFTPALIKGLRIHPENPFLFDFILDAGKNNLNQQELQSESEKMVKYFLAALTVPEKDMWVNLSPYEKSRILPDAFSHTDLGRDLLGEDYLLKQTAASAIFPEKELGKAFWSHVYKLAKEKYGTTEIPVSSFNKVWIVAGKVSVYEKPQAVYIVDSHLNVMLQEDYLATQKSSMPASSNTSCPQVSLKDQIANKISREIVLPEIEKEINEGRNFALLRQAYQSVILATWFKRALKDSILNEMYADKNKVTGIDNISSLQKQEIYDRYLQAYKKGAFNYIKDETDALTNQTISKKYFSGGMRLTPGNFEMASPAKARRVMVEATNYDLKVNLGRSSRAMVSTDSAMLYEQKNVPSNTPNVLEATDADIIFPNNPPVESVDPIDVHALREFNTLASRQVSSLKEKVDSLILDPSERISLNQLNVELKLVSDDKITKGFALSRKNKIIYVTRSFLDKILKTSDQNNFIAGMCLSLIADTGENKNENDKNFLPQDRGNQLWYLYAKSIDPSVDRRLFADDANPDKLITKIISNLLLDDKTEEQYKKEFSGLVSAVIKKESFSKFVPNENDRDEFFNNLIREKYINSAGVILKKGRVDQKKFQGFQLESKFLYLINDIKREFENAIYNQQELIKNIKKLDFVGPQIKDKFDDEEVVREARKMAYSAAYLMAFNALSGIAEYRHDDVTFENDGEIKGIPEGVKIFEFAPSKFGPPTVAHDLVMMLLPSVLMGVPLAIVNPSKNDPTRKPGVQNTFDVRWQICNNELNALFGKLMTLLPKAVSSNVLPNIKNRLSLADGGGEENLATILAWIKKMTSAVYVAGSDHRFVWRPFDGKKDSIRILGFKVVDEKKDLLKKTLLFYPELDFETYKNLIIRQEAISGARKFYINLNNGKSLEEKQILKASKNTKENPPGTLDMEYRKQVIAEIKASTNFEEMQRNLQTLSQRWITVQQSKIFELFGSGNENRSYGENLWKVLVENGIISGSMSTDGRFRVLESSQDVIRGIMNVYCETEAVAKSKTELILRIFEQSQIPVILPELDVSGKLYIIQSYFRKQDGKLESKDRRNLKVVFAHTYRKDAYLKDELTDELVNENESTRLNIVNIPGFRVPVAATSIRIAMENFFYGIIPLGMLSSITKQVLRSLLNEKETALTLARYNEVVLPVAGSRLYLQPWEEIKQSVIEGLSDIKVLLEKEGYKVNIDMTRPEWDVINKELAGKGELVITITKNNLPFDLIIKSSVKSTFAPNVGIIDSTKFENIANGHKILDKLIKQGVFVHTDSVSGLYKLAQNIDETMVRNIVKEFYPDNEPTVATETAKVMDILNSRDDVPTDIVGISYEVKPKSGFTDFSNWINNIPFNIEEIKKLGPSAEKMIEGLKNEGVLKINGNTARLNSTFEKHKIKIQQIIDSISIGDNELFPVKEERSSPVLIQGETKEPLKPNIDQIQSKSRGIKVKYLDGLRKILQNSESGYDYSEIMKIVTNRILQVNEQKGVQTVTNPAMYIQRDAPKEAFINDGTSLIGADGFGTKGGIDFKIDTSLWETHKVNGGALIKADPAMIYMIRREGIVGLRPFLVSITPMQNVTSIFGLI